METSAPSFSPGGRAYAVLGMLFAFQTLNFFDKLVFGLSAVPLMKELAITPKQFGLVGSLFFLLFSLSGTLVGLFVIGRLRTKWILVILALIWSASQLPIYFGTSLAVLACSRILLGLGEGPGLPTAFAACYDWFPAARRSVPSAVILQGISAGFLLGSPFLTFVIVHFGWRSGFLACGLLGVLWAAAWLVIGGEGPYAATPKPAAIERDTQIPGRVLWLDRTIIGIMIMSTMSYYVVGMSATWLPPYLQLGLGYTPVSTGWIISAVFAFQSPLLLGGSFLCQALQRRGWSGRISLGYASGFSLVAPGLALILATQITGPLQLVLIAIGFAAPSLTTVFGPVMLGQIAPAAQRGKLIVVIYSANSCAALLSTYGTGWIVDAAKPDMAAGFVAAIILAGIVLLAGAAASFLMLFPEHTAARFARCLAATEASASSSRRSTVTEATS
jgi:MFS family permease